MGDGYRFIGDYILRTDLLSQWIPVVSVGIQKALRDMPCLLLLNYIAFSDKPDFFQLCLR